MKKIILLGLILVFLVGCNIKCFSCDRIDELEITDFNSCMIKGNTVMESYPRQCVANGKVFIEELDEPVLGGCGTVTPGYNDECCANNNINTPHPSCVGEWKWIREGRCKFVCITQKMTNEREAKISTAEPIKYDSGEKFIPCEKDSDCIFDRLLTAYPDSILPKCTTENFCKDGVCVYNCVI